MRYTDELLRLYFFIALLYTFQCCALTLRVKTDDSRQSERNSSIVVDWERDGRGDPPSFSMNAISGPFSADNLTIDPALFLLPNSVDIVIGPRDQQSGTARMDLPFLECVIMEICAFSCSMAPSSVTIVAFRTPGGSNITR